MRAFNPERSRRAVDTERQKRTPGERSDRMPSDDVEKRQARLDVSMTVPVVLPLAIVEQLENADLRLDDLFDLELTPTAISEHKLSNWRVFLDIPAMSIDDIDKSYDPFE
jgi:hypothetical protein